MALSTGYAESLMSSGNNSNAAKAIPSTLAEMVRVLLVERDNMARTIRDLEGSIQTYKEDANDFRGAYQKECAKHQDTRKTLKDAIAQKEKAYKDLMAKVKKGAKP